MVGVSSRSLSASLYVSVTQQDLQKLKIIKLITDYKISTIIIRTQSRVLAPCLVISHLQQSSRVSVFAVVPSGVSAKLE